MCWRMILFWSFVARRRAKFRRAPAHTMPIPATPFGRRLHAVGITSRQMDPREFRELLELKIGFTDLVKHVSGSDSKLKPSDYQGERSVRKHKPFPAADRRLHEQGGLACMAENVKSQQRRLWMAGRGFEPNQILRAAVALGRCARLLAVSSLGRPWPMRTSEVWRRLENGPMRIYRNEKLRQLGIEIRAPRPGDAGYDLYSIENYSCRTGQARIGCNLVCISKSPADTSDW